MDQFEQFRAGLLLGRVNVLITLYDVDING
jgi:hypothetical protein